MRRDVLSDHLRHARRARVRGVHRQITTCRSHPLVTEMQHLSSWIIPSLRRYILPDSDHGRTKNEQWRCLPRVSPKPAQDGERDVPRQDSFGLVVAGLVQTIHETIVPIPESLDLLRALRKWISHGVMTALFLEVIDRILSSSPTRRSHASARAVCRSSTVSNTWFDRVFDLRN